MAYSVQGYASYPSLMLKKNATIVCVYGCAMIRGGLGQGRGGRPP